MFSHFVIIDYPFVVLTTSALTRAVDFDYDLWITLNKESVEKNLHAVHASTFTCLPVTTNKC